MEAPEKIYLLPRQGGDYAPYWRTDDQGGFGIEYTRTDSLIEKACKLLTRMIWEVTYEDLEGDSTQHYDKMEFIEYFRKHMKEE